MNYYINPVGAKWKSQFMEKKIKKVLIFAHMGIGNLIMFIPTIRAFRNYFKEVKFYMVVSPTHLATFKELLGCYKINHIPLIDEFIEFRGSHATLIEKIRFISKIRNEHFDMLIKNFLGGINWLLPSLRIPYRIGHISSPNFPIKFGFVFNYPVQMGKDEHEIHRNLRLFYAILPPHSARAYPIQVGAIHELPLHPAIPEAAQKFANQKVRPGSSQKLIAMQIGSSAPGDWKEWQPEKFGELANKLISEYGAKVVLLGDSRAKTKGEIVASYCNTPMLINLIGKTTIIEAAAVIKACNLLISNDAGLMWVAQSVGTPVVAIYGPTDYRRTGPVGPQDKIVRKELSCSPCYKSPTDYKKVRNCRHRECLVKITVDDVISKIKI